MIESWYTLIVLVAAVYRHAFLCGILMFLISKLVDGLLLGETWDCQNMVEL